MSKDNSILPILAGITKSIIYGFSFFFIAEALIELAPMHLLGYRFAFAALTLTILHLIGLIKIDLRKKIGFVDYFSNIPASGLLYF